ncbi:MAG: right-handed parallel beta-helix repeat-containing protein, partial [Terracidiphilus sp.]
MKKFASMALLTTVIAILLGVSAFAQTAVCGTSILNSPWNYNGTPGTYTTSGTPAGLPTFGASGTNFPNATSVVVIAAGDNSTAAGNGAYGNDDTVYYFEPGTHTITSGVMYTGSNSAYVGGYTTAAGKAIIDGAGKTGLDAANAKVANDTYEYLTIQNFSSGHNGALLGNVNGSSFATGNTYMYNTIGPNEYSQDTGLLNSTSSPGVGGGYAIDMDGNTTISYNCITHNAQGGYNGFGLSNAVTNNEISWNGLGSYPDTGGTGASPYACGCSGGGKMFFTANATVTGNYVHDNYNTGIWFDFDNTGMTITNNYISSNWSSGIFIEASYNTKIAQNTLIGNGWASDGAWPGGYNGGTCYGGISCTNGNGPVTGAGGGNPIGDIDFSDSGANANLSTIQVPNGKYTVPGCSSNCSVTSNWSGQALVQGNTIKNSFGGVKVYTDTDRYPGNQDNDSSCSIPLGALDQANSSLYYFQTEELETDSSDAVISGSTVTTSAGTTKLCNDYGQTASQESDGTYILGQNQVQAPSVGMGVFDINAGTFLGNVASVSSANQFTLNQSPGNRSNARLMVAAYGGCGPADDFGGAPGVTSGNPAEYYFDNCVWGGRGVTISGNVQSANGTTITGCTTANGCGFTRAIAFLAGVPTLMQFFDDYQNVVALASGGLGNVFSNNTYTWSGGGPGAFSFVAGNQNSSTLTQAQWQASPYGQDAGSTFGTGTTPIISFSPGIVTFTATQGGSSPASQNVTVSNSGAGTLAKPTTSTTYNNGSGWLTVTVQGSSAPYTLVNQPSISGLAAGTYTATVSVASSGATNTPQTYSVIITVYSSSSSSPAISLSPTSLSFSATVGGANPSAQNVTVSNSGGGTLASPTTSINYTCSTQPTTGSLAAGTYNATVQVSCTGATNSPQSYTVAFTVSSSPAISLSPTSLTFNATVGGGNPSSQNVTVSNSGGGTLAVPTTSTTYHSGSGWLSVQVQGSQAPYTLVTQPTT